jgi:hypothetical protein
MSASLKISLEREMINATSRGDPNFLAIAMTAGNQPSLEQGMVVATSRDNPNFPKARMRTEAMRNRRASQRCAIVAKHLHQ